MDGILQLLSGLATLVFAFAFIFNAATRNEIKKDETLQRSSAQGVLRMRRVTGRLMGVSGVALLLIFAIGSQVLEDEPTTTNDETVVAEEEQEAETNYEELARTASDLHTLKKALQGIDDSVKDVRFINELVVIQYDGDAVHWDETALFEEFATDSTDILAAMNGSMNYSAFAFEIPATLIDDKGNEEVVDVIRVLYRENALRAINFDNYPDVVASNPYKFYTNATGYGLYGAIYLQLDEDIRYSMGAFKDPETDVYNVYDF